MATDFRGSLQSTQRILARFAILDWHPVCKSLRQSRTDYDPTMPQPDVAFIPPVTGEVVEVYQKSGVATAKIAIRMCHIEVPMELLDDPHLGDRILFEADVRLRHIETLYSNGFHAASEQGDGGGL